MTGHGHVDDKSRDLEPLLSRAIKWLKFASKPIAFGRLVDEQSNFRHPNHRLCTCAAGTLRRTRHGASE